MYPPTSFERALQIHLCAALLFVVGPKLTACGGLEGKTAVTRVSLKIGSRLEAPEEK